MLLIAKTGSLNLILPAVFLFGLLGLGIAVAIGAFRNDRSKRQELLEAARQEAAENKEYLRRSEERTIAYFKRSEEHFDRVEKSLGEISEKLGNGA